MGQQIVKQPNGLFAVWSSIVDNFVITDATPEEIIEEWSEREARRIRVDVTEWVARLNAGKRGGSFTKSYDECLDLIREVHGREE